MDTDIDHERKRNEAIMKIARTAKTLTELDEMDFYNHDHEKPTIQHLEIVKEYGPFPKVVLENEELDRLYETLQKEEGRRSIKKAEHIQNYGNIGTKNHYKVVRAVGYTDLEKKVNEYLEKGYNISGGLTIEVTKRQSIPDYFYQVVFRKGIEVQVLPRGGKLNKKKSKKSIVKRKRKTRKHYK